MAKRHQSFVVRCWLLDRGEQRFDIEHIQSGEKHLARSAVEAIEWIHDRTSRGPPVQDTSEERGATRQGNGERHETMHGPPNTR